MPTNEDIIAKLTRQNDELENYFRNTIIPQLFIDGDLRLRKFTPPAMKQFNLSAADLNQPIRDIHDNFRFPSFIENVEKVIADNEILEKEIQTSDKRWYQMNIIPYVQKKGNVANGVIVTFVEITYRIKDLKEQEKLIADHETLLDTLSHDIRNPLSNMILAIEQFKSINPSDQVEFDSLLTIVERSLNNMQKLIQDLTEVREADHKYKSHVELLDLENILEDVRLTLSDDISASGTILKWELQVTELSFSRRKLRSIIFNLVNNAIKYRSPERTPEIFVSSFSKENQVIISIKDNGLGIDTAKQTAVFSKYYRIDNAIEGSGIGLYLVKQLVKSAGGVVELQSLLNEGTEIRIIFNSNK
ncbi:MAG: PAS domain-containing protein [Rhizobacter sp.]|nr:PAS domain-containing protein [Ferruginibacter sp.]